MKRIILIGNGFDLAHGLETKYEHFIDNYWERKLEFFIKSYHEGKLSFRTQGVEPIFDYEDEDITINGLRYFQNLTSYADVSKKHGYDKFHHYTMTMPATQERKFQLKNKFLEQLSTDKKFPNWVDIEIEYFRVLTECIETKRKGGVEQLNKEFSKIKDALEIYLISQTERNICKSSSIEENIYLPVSFEDFKKGSNTNENICSTLYLNFNYTTTEKLYIKNNGSETVIHIHGELGNKETPIIFGYGDESDEKFNLIKNNDDNRYFENIKSIKYAETEKRNNLMNFIDSDIYSIFIMGHSCGKSDRTLLTKLFNHENCISIRVFYKENDNGTNNFIDITSNISRCFNNVDNMNDKLVPMSRCKALS